MQVSVTKEKPARIIGGGRGQTGGQVQTTSAFPRTSKDWGLYSKRQGVPLIYLEMHFKNHKLIDLKNSSFHLQKKKLSKKYREVLYTLPSPNSRLTYY